MSELSYEVLVNDGLRRQRDQRLPDGSPIISSPVASTLIYGDRDAVLVDPPFTRDQVSRIGDWIEQSGKHLKAVYATHGHGDHWFGTDLLLQRFPGAVAYATEGTIAMMHEQGTVGRAQLWDVDFPGRFPQAPWFIAPFPPTGSSWRASDWWRSKSATPTPTTPPCCMCPRSALSSPATLRTTACTNTYSRALSGGVEAWLAALDKVAALEPSAVVAGHKNKDLPDDPAIIDQTRQYLLDARRLLAEKPAPRAYFDEMITLYPDRLNVGPVWYTAVALLPEESGK